MLRRSVKRILVLSVVATLFAVGAPARADTASETDYFHCAPDETTPIVTVNTETDTSTPSWNGSAPANSAAGGCIGVTDSLFTGQTYRTPYDTPFAGSFTGNIDSITLRLYFAAIRGLRQNIGVRIHVGIDGKSLFGVTTGTTGTVGPAAKEVVVQPVLKDSNLSFVEFTITKIGFAEEPGTGDTEHEVDITIGSTTEPVVLLPFDSTEAPAGLSFNPQTPAPTQVKATTPGPA